MWGLIALRFELSATSRTGAAKAVSPLLDFLLMAVVLVAIPSGSWAAWVPGGVQLCGPGCVGSAPIVVADGEGGAYVGWNGHRPLESTSKLYVHRLTRDGELAPGWPVNGIRVGRESSGLQGYSLALDGAGGVYAAWSDFPAGDIYLQRLTGGGEVSPGWPVAGLQLCTAVGHQNTPSLTRDGAGGVFVIWEDGRTSGLQRDIYGSRVLSDGSLAPGWPINGLALCTAPNEQLIPLSASDGSGGAYVTWDDGRNTPWDLYLLRIGADGLPTLGWQPDGNLIRGGPYYDVAPSLVPDGADGAYVSWVEDPFDSSYEMDLYLLRVGGGGAVYPGWPLRGVPISIANGPQYDPRTAPDGFGGVIVSWNNNADIYALRVLPDGSRAPGWPENGRFVGGESNGRVASDAAGGAYFTYERWGTPNTVHVQHLTGDGGVVPGWEGGIPVVPGAVREQKNAAIVADGSGGAIVVWEDDRVQGQDIYAQKFVADGPTPTLLSLVSFEAQQDHVLLTWHRAGGDAGEATVYRRTESIGWLPLGQATFDASGIVRYEDRSVSAGRRYAYRLGVREAGVESFSAETWVDVPAALQLALEGLRPNPAVDRLRVSLTLPRRERASLELLDVSGRAVIQREVGDLGPGQHLLSIGDTRDVSPGIYWLRLTTDDRSLVARATVVR